MSNKVTLEQLLPTIDEILQNGGTATFTPNGISMRPMLESGRDTVTLKKAQKPLKKYDLPLYRNQNGKFVLHRVIGKNGDGYITRGDNRLEKEFGITNEMIIGKVVLFTRKGKEYSVNNIFYRIYCLLRNNDFTVFLRKIKLKIKNIIKK